MKKKFKIYYPEGHTLAGKCFKVKNHQSIVMTGGGHFMVLSKPSPYDLFVTPLHSVIDGGIFDVEWEDG